MVPNVYVLVRVFPIGSTFDLVRCTWQGRALLPPGSYTGDQMVPVPTDVIGPTHAVKVDVVVWRASTLQVFVWSSAFRDDPATAKDETWAPVGQGARSDAGPLAVGAPALDVGWKPAGGNA